MKPDICLYHGGGCPDGFGAAWAVWHRWADAVEYVPVQYKQDPPDVAGKHVLIVDFSYPKAVLERMGETALSITILDHHESAQSQLDEFAVFNPVSWQNIDEILAATQPGLGNIRAMFNMQKSGAVLAWEFCNPRHPIPEILKYVQDQDLWKFQLPESHKINFAISSWPKTFQNWSIISKAIVTSYPRLVEIGAAVERRFKIDVDAIIAQTKRTMIIGGHTVPVANAPHGFASHVAGALAEGQPFGACYYDRADGMRTFSLRRRDGDINVAQIAMRYGGGGHAPAAGFEMARTWDGDNDIS